MTNKEKKYKQDKTAGIDLGTTYSCIATNIGNDIKIIPLKDGQLTMPSVVSFVKGQRIVGSSAKKQIVTNSANTVRSIKRFMGQKDYKVSIENEKYSPSEISSYILNKLVEDAEEYLNANIVKVVITVPAYFNDLEREATKEAAKIAGLEVLQLINEPTAAALAYGLETKIKQNVLVYDLGGGTFDLSLVQMEDGVFEVLKTDGDSKLGGDDFDDAVAEWITSIVLKEASVDLRNNLQAKQKIYVAVEEAKKELSGIEETFINIPGLAKTADGIYDFNKSLTRSKFNQLTSSLVKKTEDMLKKLLQESTLSMSEINEIVMVGGSSRIPAVREMVSKVFNGKRLNFTINPDQVVAYGAAVQSLALSGQAESLGFDAPVLIDTTSLSYGIEVAYGECAILIPRNTAIPTTKTETFSNHTDNQPKAVIRVLQGERPLASENKEIGIFEVEITPAKRMQAQIEVIFSIDINGLLEVTAVDKNKNKKANISINKPNLTAEEIKEAIDRAEQFKDEDIKATETRRKTAAIDDITFEIEEAKNSGKLNDDQLAKIDEISNEVELLKNKQNEMSKDQFLQEINVHSMALLKNTENNSEKDSTNETSSATSPDNNPNVENIDAEEIDVSN